MIDPAPSGLTRVLSAADQLVLIAPASPDAATSLANTQQWLGAHGYGELVGACRDGRQRSEQADDAGRAPGRIRGQGPLPGHRPGAMG